MIAPAQAATVPDRIRVLPNQGIAETQVHLDAKTDREETGQ